MIAGGGAGKLNDIFNVFDNTTATAVSCGTMFVFFGAREAVLINYPDIEQMEKVMSKYD